MIFMMKIIMINDCEQRMNKLLNKQTDKSINKCNYHLIIIVLIIIIIATLTHQVSLNLFWLKYILLIMFYRQLML